MEQGNYFLPFFLVSTQLALLLLAMPDPVLGLGQFRQKLGFGFPIVRLA